MKKIFKILSLLLYVTLLSSCISSTIPNKLKMAQGKAFYTTCNIWYEKPARIFSTNYHKGRMITAGTKVTINSIKKGMINFTVNETGVPFTLILVRKHSTITLKEYFERYFSEQNVMDYPNGLFHKFSKIEQENIQNGNLESGMSRKAVLMAFGYPPSHKTRSLEKDIWYYWTNKFQKISVHWKNDKLVKIKGGRRADEGSTHFIPDKPGKHPKSDKQAIVVAVTDFENLVGQKEHNWLRVGIPELMTTYFSKIKGIKIIERSIIEKDLSKESPLTKDIASGIGKQVGATYIILGSYKTRGKEITVNTRMLKTESGKILRAEQETGKLSETDSVVGALILKIAGVMGRTISNAEKRLLKVQGTNMMKVIEGLSKGQLARNRGDLDGARKYYQDALKNDPTNKSILQHIKDIDVELKSIAIVDFKNNSKDAGFDHLSNAVPEELTTLMIHKTALSFTERLNIEKAIEELKLGKTEKIDKNTAPKVGRLAGATQLMIGSFSVI
ncbi:MAG: hypothetical protein GY749_21385, partial [Desulfobacteraceae bacterium]|nr:hypothetical protein [Desulfobacteraceae bacterium]